MTDLPGCLFFRMLTKEQLKTVPKITERRKAGKQGKKSSAPKRMKRRLPQSQPENDDKNSAISFSRLQEMSRGVTPEMTILLSSAIT